jgi:hypothetical protein
MSLNRKPEINFMDTMFCLPKEEGGNNQRKHAGAARGGHCFVRVNNTLLKIPGNSVSLTGTEQLVNEIEVTENDPRAVKTWALNSKGEVLDQPNTTSQISSQMKAAQKLPDSKEAPQSKNAEPKSTKSVGHSADTIVGLKLTTGEYDFTNQNLHFKAPAGKSIVGITIAPGSTVTLKGLKISVTSG